MLFAYGFLAAMASVGGGMLISWLTFGLMGKSAKHGADGSFGGALIALGFVIKLPIICVVMVLIRKQGQPAINGFLAGMAVVYSALVWFGATNKPN